MSNGHSSTNSSDSDQADAVPFVQEPDDFNNGINDAPPVPPLRKKYKNKNNKNATPKSVDPLTVSVKSATNVINISKSKKVQIGNNITYVLNNKSPTQPASCEDTQNVKPRIKTQRHISIMGSTDKIQPSYIDRISGKIDDWRGLFRDLDYKEPEIEIFYETHFSKGIKEVIYQLLLDWIQNNDKRLGGLCDMLWDEQKYSLVDELIEMHAQYNFDKMEE